MLKGKFALSVLVLGLAVAVTADAASIGRSGGGSSGRSSSSFSSSRSTSYSAPSRPSTPSPSPSVTRPTQTATSSGIGGTSGSMGVRKSEVTAPVAAKVNQSRNPTPSPTTTPSYSNSYPTYGTTHAPVAVAPVQSGWGTFGSSLAGSFTGTMLGNALFGHHGGGGTTVINNGTPGVSGTGGGTVVAGGPVSSVDRYDAAIAAKSYGIGDFIIDVILFTILIALLVGVAFLFYKGFKMIRDYVNRERGVAQSQPFSPTQKFWEVQNAFSAADEPKLRQLLGPDLVDEATRDLQPVVINLRNVSHEVVLSNPSEFSVHYKFNDEGEPVDQVWHYERFSNDWKLNGIETV